MPSAYLSVYDEVLKWSKGRAEWQRDALRRLVVIGTLEPHDIDELLLLCKIENGIEDPAKHKLAPIPLDDSHICHDTAPGSPVTLAAISDVVNVNAIASPNPVSFNESGLTIIYGDNGTGKSGYVRILKNVCRARKVEPKILRNVFVADDGKAPSANISFKVGDTSHTFPWEKDKQGPADLSCVNVFDSGCASVYVSEDNRIVYMPLGLDVFDKLVKVCDAIRARLVIEKDKFISTFDKLPIEYEDTNIGKWYASIKRNTTGEEVLNKTIFTEVNKKRLTWLQEALLEGNKKKRANELRMKKERYERLQERIKAIMENLSDEAIQRLKGAKSSLETASKAGELASKEAFDKEKVKGIGSDPWWELWKAAKKFSETEAYPGKEFPNTELGSKCVLCLQDLEPEAIKRMERFKKFVQDEVALNENKAKQEYEKEIGTLGDFEITERGDEILLKELKEDDELLANSLNTYLEAAKITKAAALKACEDGTWEGITSLAETSPEEQLTDRCADLEFTAKILEEAKEPELLPRLQAEFRELSAKKWVSVRSEEIGREILRQQWINLYDKAISDTNTGPITKAGTILTDTYVTEELKSRFMEQLKAIYKEDLKVSLEKKQGEKGATYYCISLKDCTVPKANVTDVISEGEFHAVAIAAFLAETSFSPTKSGIAFDDPVSSLDHEIREKLAKQLVELAKDRQMIVFTHDLFFFVSLREIAKKEKVSLLDQNVVKGYTGPGACYPEAPWEALEVTKRIKKLKNLTEEAEKKYKEGMPEYEKIAGFVCLRIRKTIERAVEEILLCDIVHRYRRNLYAQNVRKLEKMTLNDIKFLEDLMTRYSVELHDQAEESKAKIPTPKELKEDVQNLEAWVKQYKER